jgi:transposase-like protein
MNARPPDVTPGAVRVAAMAAGRRADTERRRQRVLKALETAAGTGEEISVSATARRAGVDRTFLYRHRDLLAQVHASEALPSAARPAAGPAVTRASLQADLLAAHERSARLAARIRQLEHRLSDALGEQVWRESGLGQPDDIGQLKQQVTYLAEENNQLRGSLAERDQDLAAARAASRELMARLNTRS